ncbi:hypothetical protein ANN_14741 [Periplaneta americana]|uniref:Uncharacterized protein n=1 Tax=Periplaneta americana TaxID=6978 RepID=A0ABQ8SX49_PERAM|nr:hypothetical protein ANN_14741 [Periplaneta americana]
MSDDVVLIATDCAVNVYYDYDVKLGNSSVTKATLYWVNDRGAEPCVQGREFARNAGDEQLIMKHASYPVPVAPVTGLGCFMRADFINKQLSFGLCYRRNEGSRFAGMRNKLLSSSLLSKNLKVRIYKTVILPVLLYGCETWTLTLREEHRLRVFENKVLRKIFGAKRDEVTEEWRKLHNTELHALYSSPDIIRNLKSRCLRWAGHVARMGESRNAYRVLVGRPEGKRPLGRPRRRWEDNIKMDLREVGYDDRDWINLAQDRDRWRAYVRAAMNLWVP